MSTKMMKARAETTPAPPRVRRITSRQVTEAVARIRKDAHGHTLIQRFSTAQRVEHQLLIISFTLLALTGLPQRYAGTPVGSLVIQLLGGIEMTRQIHHLFAFMFALETVYHLGGFIYRAFVYRSYGSIWPKREDFAHLGQMLRLNLGVGKAHPHFGRYSFEEKVEYWALVWGTALMGLTGFIQWFPGFFARWLPGVAVPISRTLHSWEAVLAVLSILTWHMYHTVIKTNNKSIFTGYMTEEEMREEHPAELEELLRVASFAHRLHDSQPAGHPAPAASDTLAPILVPVEPGLPAETPAPGEHIE